MVEGVCLELSIAWWQNWPCHSHKEVKKILNRNFCVQCIRALPWPAAFTGGFVAAFHRKQYGEGKGNWHPKEGNPGTWEH